MEEGTKSKENEYDDSNWVPSFNGLFFFHFLSSNIVAFLILNVMYCQLIGMYSGTYLYINIGFLTTGFLLFNLGKFLHVCLTPFSL